MFISRKEEFPLKQFEIMVGLKKKAAFEGWFVKVDDKVNELLFSVIWGYSTHEKTKHAFLQFQDNLRNDTAYISYPIEDLSWTSDPFELQIGKNKLSESGMHLDFEMDGIAVFGDFQFGDLSPIQVSFLKPNIMGWLSYFPNECNHAIISMGHKVSGSLQFGNQTFQISDADGYMEKDWGTGFPKEYVWLQANDWPHSAVVFSYATVPMLGKHAKGFFAVLNHEGQEYRFSSIEGSKMAHFDVGNDGFQASISKSPYRLDLEAKQADPVALASPVQGEMKAYIKESLEGSLVLRLKKKNETVVELCSNRASIDVHFHHLTK